jgi:hypothetical protein
LKKVLVALPNEIVKLVDVELRGRLGEGRSDTLRAIILSWLSEKGYFTNDGGTTRKQAAKRRKSLH